MTCACAWLAKVKTTTLHKTLKEAVRKIESWSVLFMQTLWVVIWVAWQRQLGWSSLAADHAFFDIFKVTR